MLGRLARYLRFFGHDTRYQRGLGDDEILARAARERRTILTRDRALAARAASAVLLRSTAIGDQIRELDRNVPGLSMELRFDRCPLCNSGLEPWTPPTDRPFPDGVPRERVDLGLRVFACGPCGRQFWEGSHAERIRRDLLAWRAAVP